MKSIKILSLLLLCLNMTLLAQVSLLEQKVDFSYREKPLGDILNDLSLRYNVNFSYVNNVIPVDQVITSEGKNISLRDGLEIIFFLAEIDYQVINGQIVLKKKPVKNEPFPKPADGAGNLEKTGKQASSKQESLASSSKENTVNESRNEIHEAERQDPNGSIHKNIPEDIKVHEELPQEGFSSEDPIEEGLIQTQGTESVEVADPVKLFHGELNQSKISGSDNKESTAKPSSRYENEGIPKAQLSEKEKEVWPGDEPDPSFDIDIEYSEESLRHMHLGWFYPLSTNGTEAYEFVNNVSLHLLIGVSKGVDGVEFSGFGNVSRDFTRGVQAAGFFNVTGGPVDGVQAAGFINLNSGNVNGLQAAGFINVSNGNASAMSVAGFANIRNGMLDGAEIAGFTNISRNVDGFQASGFINIAEEVDGVQVAGFINRATRVKGTQIGIINIADTVDGVPIGIFNIIKKGYRKLEVFGSESFHANVAYKMGVQKFYTIFALGARFQDNFVWGYGLGFGSQFRLNPAWNMSLDLTGYNIVEQEFRDGWIGRGSDNYFFLMDYVNSNNNLRIGFDRELGPRLALTFGPSFNVLVRSKYDKHGNAVESAFVPYSLFEISGSKRDVIMWPGFFLGVRF